MGWVGLGDEERRRWVTKRKLRTKELMSMEQRSRKQKHTQKNFASLPVVSLSLIIRTLWLLLRESSSRLTYVSLIFHRAVWELHLMMGGVDLGNCKTLFYCNVCNYFWKYIMSLSISGDNFNNTQIISQFLY